jgi:hypothetical protein
MSTAADVRTLMSKDFGPEALKWIDDVKWEPAVKHITHAQINNTYHTEEFSAAKGRTAKVREFVKKIQNGFDKPIICLKVPGYPGLCAIDGHTRIAAYDILKKPIPAYIGTAPSANGGWEKTHSQQKGRTLQMANDKHDEEGKFSRTAVPITPAIQRTLTVYQQQQGLPVTGELDEATHQRISENAKLD